MTTPAKALHSWSLFRTLGRFVAHGSMPSGGMPAGGGGGLDLLALPAALAEHGFSSVQLCHFYLPRVDPDYLAELRTSFDAAGVDLECFLIDDGDLVHPSDAAAQLDWISRWIEVAEQLGVQRVRVPAGQQPPTPERIAASAAALLELADRHPSSRIVIENWLALTPDAASVNALLDQTHGRIGFLIDLGNWTGEGKYAELEAVAARAETCQAKVMTDQSGAIDADDYRRVLGILKAADYSGPLAMVHDGPDGDEWGKLDEAYGIVQEVWGQREPK